MPRGKGYAKRGRGRTRAVFNNASTAMSRGNTRVRVVRAKTAGGARGGTRIVRRTRTTNTY